MTNIIIYEKCDFVSAILKRNKSYNIQNVRGKKLLNKLIKINIKRLVIIKNYPQKTNGVYSGF